MPRPIRSDTEPSLPNHLEAHQLAAAADPHIPIRTLTRRDVANDPDGRAGS